MVKVQFVFCLLVILATGQEFDGQLIQSVEYSYWRSPVQETWTNAYSRCRELSGELVSPQNPGLDDNLRNFLIVDEATNPVWIGAKLFDDGWRWPVSDTPMIYTNFRGNCNETASSVCATGSPATDENPWGWCSNNCEDEYEFVCQFPKEPTGSPITTAETTATSEPSLSTDHQPESSSTTSSGGSSLSTDYQTESKSTSTETSQSQHSTDWSTPPTSASTQNFKVDLNYSYLLLLLLWL